MEGTVPDLVVVFGIRTILSFIGITIVAVSFWLAERKWDEEGSAAYARAEGSSGSGDYQMVVDGKSKKMVTNSDGSRDAISVSTEDYQSGGSTVSIPKEELEKCLPVPIAMIVGFGIWALSFLFVADDGLNVYVDWNLCFVILLPAIAFGIAYPIRTATMDRDLEMKKRAVSLVLVACAWLTLSAILDPGSDAPWYFSVGGVLVLFLSYHILRRARKMGVTWELEGRPYTDVPVQSLGALTMIYGLFLVWVGTNAQEMADIQHRYIPIYLNYRACLVFVAGLGIIVPSLVALDVAFEKGSTPVGYGLDGRNFKEASKAITFLALEPIAGSLETSWPFIAGWCLFGLTAFMPFGNGFTVQKLFVLLISFMVGPVYGLKVLPAYWTSEPEEYRKWTYIYYSLMVFLCTSIGIDGETTLIMAMIGAVLILFGQHLDMLEKKRGKVWVEHRQVNPKSVVFGYGHPIYIFGWILVCLAMAIPM